MEGYWKKQIHLKVKDIILLKLNREEVKVVLKWKKKRKIMPKLEQQTKGKILSPKYEITLKNKRIIHYKEETPLWDPSSAWNAGDK